ncbi:hypothetical protein Mpal_0893 [Methanosphaerula palustris E1-9c]|uniref:Uncharacterized protein n=1 Tax=Methanosphaerula palustris (strain ATCC BAA-1556 / DSM 19958 / E1-9c) TaxID=521011 RepID=B8GGJ4_METPE|nr:hypothetical protein Mpal_0893 [Methanosphaerula palustris E1-9c]
MPDRDNHKYPDEHNRINLTMDFGLFLSITLIRLNAGNQSRAP